MIQRCLNAKSADQIATKVCVSGGNVSGIIKEWIAEIGQPNVEPRGDFVTMLNKPGISIKQCAKGLQMLKLLKNLGINEQTDGHGGIGNNGYDGNNDCDQNKQIIFVHRENLLKLQKVWHLAIPSAFTGRGFA